MNSGPEGSPYIPESARNGMDLSPLLPPDPSQTPEAPEAPQQPVVVVPPELGAILGQTVVRGLRGGSGEGGPSHTPMADTDVAGMNAGLDRFGTYPTAPPLPEPGTTHRVWVADANAPNNRGGYWEERQSPVYERVPVDDRDRKILPTRAGERIPVNYRRWQLRREERHQLEATHDQAIRGAVPGTAAYDEAIQDAPGIGPVGRFHAGRTARRVRRAQRRAERD